VGVGLVEAADEASGSHSRPSRGQGRTLGKNVGLADVLDDASGIGLNEEFDSGHLLIYAMRSIREVRLARSAPLQTGSSLVRQVFLEGNSSPGRLRRTSQQSETGPQAAL
jgi:hypothetical protein